MTYEQLQMDGLPSTESEPKILQSSPQGSRANPTLLREKVWAIVTSVTCGEKLQECLKRLDRVGSSVKIRPVYSQGKISDISDECLTTLPRWGIALGGEFGALATSERRISATECSLWRTPMASDGIFSNRTEAQLAKRWANKNIKQKHLSEQVQFMETFPTPTVADSKNVGFNGSHQFNLHKYIALFPTPTVNGNYNRKGASTTSGDGLATVVGGKLNPTWVEWLMGFPLGWTDLEE